MHRFSTDMENQTDQEREVSPGESYSILSSLLLRMDSLEGKNVVFHVLLRGQVPKF